MTANSFNPLWTVVVPLVVWGVLIISWFLPPTLPFVTLLGLCLIASVIVAVHHAEVIALKVGEPFGTLILALSVAIIEVSLIVSMILSGGPEAMALPRDTIFAAVMIVLNGMIGVSLFVGGIKHKTQLFNVEGMTDAIGVVTVIVGLILVFPNFSAAAPGPIYSPLQLMFVALATLAIFVGFILFQTVLHREYFQSDDADDGHGSDHPDNSTTLISLALLVLSLTAVVLAAKAVSPTLESFLGQVGAPAATLGIVIAALVLMPEFGASLRAARENRMQSSLNLAMSSVIASIGLTVPVVAALGIFLGWPLELGLEPASMVLLTMTLFLTALSLRTGNTTLQPGLAHLVLFAIYIFFSFVP